MQRTNNRCIVVQAFSFFFFHSRAYTRYGPTDVITKISFFGSVFLEHYLILSENYCNLITCNNQVDQPNFSIHKIKCIFSICRYISMKCGRKQNVFPRLQIVILSLLLFVTADIAIIPIYYRIFFVNHMYTYIMYVLNSYRNICITLYASSGNDVILLKVLTSYIDKTLKFTMLIETFYIVDRFK